MMIFSKDYVFMNFWSSTISANLIKYVNWFIFRVSGKVNWNYSWKCQINSGKLVTRNQFKSEI